MFINYKKEIIQEWILKEESENPEKDYNWHRHFNVTIGDRQVVLCRDNRKGYLEVRTTGFISKYRNPNWQDYDPTNILVNKYTKEQYKLAVNRFIGCLMELLTQDWVLKYQHTFGLSEYVREDEEDNGM